MAVDIPPLNIIFVLERFYLVVFVVRHYIVTVFWSSHAFVTVFSTAIIQTFTENAVTVSSLQWRFLTSIVGVFCCSVLSTRSFIKPFHLLLCYGNINTFLARPVWKKDVIDNLRVYYDIARKCLEDLLNCINVFWGFPLIIS